MGLPNKMQEVSGIATYGQTLGYNAFGDMMNSRRDIFEFVI